MKSIIIKAFNETTLEEQKKAIENLSNNSGNFKMIGKIVKAGTTVRNIPIGNGNIQRSKVTISRGITGLVILDIVNATAININRELIHKLYEARLLDVKIEGKLISPKFDVTGAFPQYTDINTLLDFNDQLQYVLLQRIQTGNNNSYLIMTPGFYNGLGKALILDKCEMLQMFTSDSPPFTLANARVSKEKDNIILNNPRW